MSQRAALAVAFLVGGLASSAFAGRIGIDLTQADLDLNGNHSADDTWRWNNGDPNFFDLEFSSGNGGHIDLDGGAAAANEYYTGSVGNNYTHDYLWATYLGGNAWRIDAVRGMTTTVLGIVTEYSGALSHKDNYGFDNEESHIVNGPTDASANASPKSKFKGWFWIYRDTLTDTISLNIIVGSSSPTTPNDGGQFRAEFLFDGAFSGTPSLIQGNEPSQVDVDGGNPNRFLGTWNWNDDHDDGASLGAIRPFAESVPLPPAAWSGLALLAALGIGRRMRRRSSTLN